MHDVVLAGWKSAEHVQTPQRKKETQRTWQETKTSNTTERNKEQAHSKANNVAFWRVAQDEIAPHDTRQICHRSQKSQPSVCP